MKFLHTIEIVSEHENYGDMRDVVRDAYEEDAILRSWSTKSIDYPALTELERDFFYPPELAVEL